MSSKIQDTTIQFPVLEEFQATFSENIRERLAKLGLRRSRLCAMTGLSPASLYPIVGGTRMPSLYVSAKIAAALNCTVDNLSTPKKLPDSEKTG